ncbi:hypothetical protein [uncultured Corynebacterium sp.]|uniref:hypothetical protein n=1 Tax=uncultured Corynebacterium sp. TaxID=159447 RepID=UPI002592978A|nr:hypothetical protein [uncultured Corynebacterium sp.]
MGRHLIETAVEQARSQEPVWLRYKASILIVATGLVAILAQLAESADWQGTQTGAVLTAVVTAASFLLNRFTRDGITPSMAPRIAQAVGETGGA